MFYYYVWYLLLLFTVTVILTSSIMAARSTLWEGRIIFDAYLQVVRINNRCSTCLSLNRLEFMQMLEPVNQAITGILGTKVWGLKKGDGTYCLENDACWKNK